jgi:crotonobetainyl-CoA:carnitine CoA-transferase CaiB-like acyl-CoA transferase
MAALIAATRASPPVPDERMSGRLGGGTDRIGEGSGRQTEDVTGEQALAGLRVVEVATVVAAPGIGKYLADFGAEVVKVEPPGGDPNRRMGWRHPDDPDAYFHKITNRGKQSIVLDLKTDGDRRRLLDLIVDADVLVENMRPGKLESLGLGPGALHRRNPRLVITRVTGFGQDGPYAARPGFATLAEALSGYAAISGEPDGGPLLPPIALTDEVTALVGAFATLVAVRHAERSGEGQVVDVNLLESMLQLMGPLPAAYAHLGYLQPRLGSGIPYSVPRGTYRCADGVWVAVSTSAESVALRVLGLVGAADDPRFTTFPDRMTHRESLDALVRGWIAARPSAEVLAAFEAADAAIAPVHDMAAVVADPHVRARQALVEIDGVLMQNVVARLSRTPGRIRHAGVPLEGQGGASSAPAATVRATEGGHAEVDDDDSAGQGRDAEHEVVRRDARDVPSRRAGPLQPGAPHRRSVGG